MQTGSQYTFFTHNNTLNRVVTLYANVTERRVRSTSQMNVQPKYKQSEGTAACTLLIHYLYSTGFLIPFFTVFSIRFGPVGYFWLHSGYNLKS